MLIPIGFTIFSAAYSAWFICATCGYMESWVEHGKDLEAIRRRASPMR